MAAAEEDSYFALLETALCCRVGKRRYTELDCSKLVTIYSMIPGEVMLTVRYVLHGQEARLPGISVLHTDTWYPNLLPLEYPSGICELRGGLDGEVQHPAHSWSVQGGGVQSNSAMTV